MGPWDLIAVNRRSVVRRAFGARRERAAHAAFLLNLGLRSGAKRVVGRDAARDRQALRAAVRARATELPPLGRHPGPGA